MQQTLAITVITLGVGLCVGMLLCLNGIEHPGKDVPLRKLRVSRALAFGPQPWNP
ncbi:hypothetical protein [Plastoroseomonas arctica]|uniref:Uncharacterized protein n=1 Tax=Plastoroseomonas arctica TaxID=1509237 RepID=A0AAF1KMD9_9PROT|nr:hypothetical protein [Plastoroseomonas arctica]MBR0656246.1 hypothetical protein [Plastoroseomonas arctica]